MIFVDTNIWIYYFDRRFPEHEWVVAPLERAIRSAVGSNTVVLMEVAHYFGGLPEDEFWDRINYLTGLATMEVVDLDYNLMMRSFELLEENSKAGIGGRDSTILAAMERLNTRDLMTHDKTFRRVPSIRVRDQIFR